MLWDPHRLHYSYLRGKDFLACMAAAAAVDSSNNSCRAVLIEMTSSK